MQILLLALLACAALLAIGVHSYPHGAPKGACSTLCPTHDDHWAQNGTAPYTLTASKSTVGGNETVTVTLRGNSNRNKFKGFILAARKPTTGRNQRSGTNVGTFAISDGQSDKAKILECNGKKEAVTHISADDKNEVQVVWTAPASFKGRIEFRGTVVKEFDKFYKIKSNQLNFK